MVPSLTIRPHDRVPLKEMKTDWHACLDNRVGFKVKCDNIVLETGEVVLLGM